MYLKCPTFAQSFLRGVSYLTMTKFLSVEYKLTSDKGGCRGEICLRGTKVKQMGGRVGDVRQL